MWFCRAYAANFDRILAHYGRWLGDYTAHGFGQIVIGHWPSTPDLKNET